MSQNVTLAELQAAQRALPAPSELDESMRRQAQDYYEVRVLTGPVNLRQPGSMIASSTTIRFRLVADRWVFQGQVELETPEQEARRSVHPEYAALNIQQMLALFPVGFAVGYSGSVSRIRAASSQPLMLMQAHPIPPSRGGYLVVESVSDQNFG